MKHAAFSNAFNADFDEGKHKRDDSGRFSKSGGGGKSSKSSGGSSKTEKKASPKEAIPPISDDVSLDHINSLMAYTGNSSSINGGLRNGKLSERDKKIVKHLDEVISSAKPTKADTTVYRGITADSDFAKKLSSAKEGEVISDKAFMSTSVNKSKALEYARDAGDSGSKKGKSGGVVMEINVPKGTKTINLSGESDVNSNEEVILGRGTSVKVTSVTKKGGETHVKVDVVKSEAPSKQTSTPSKEKAASTGSPPEPLGKVYRKQVETLIGTDTKEAKALKTVYSQLLEAKSAEEQTKLKGEVNKIVKKIKGLNIRPFCLRG